MKKRFKFEEEVVEETTTTEETVEESPDQHEAFVTILVDMGLSAEQAEAVHSMAMELVDAGGGEETTEEVSTEEKVEASRQGRRRSNRAQLSRRGRTSLSQRQGRREGRREMSQGNATERRLNRLERQNIMLRKQLREFGASPAAAPLRHAPAQGQPEQAPASNGLTGNTARAFDMINNNKR